jgi:hypothetical protein
VAAEFGVAEDITEDLKGLVIGASLDSAESRPLRGGIVL